MIRLIERRPILTIILLVGAMLLPFLNVFDVTIMEARNFISAREMLTDGNWILTTLNGEPRYEKPPLPTWFSAISGYIFGAQSVWAMRLPAALMVMVLGSVVYSLSRKFLLSKSHSLINGLVCITSLYVILIVFEAPWDIYAHTFMFAAIYCLYSYLRPNSVVEGLPALESSSSFKYVVGAVLFFGASILSKGPVSLYVLFIPFIISYLIVYGKETPIRKWIGFVIACIVGFSIGFSWYIYLLKVDPIAFEGMSGKETGNWASRNVRPFYYYWSFFIQSGLWALPALISLLFVYMKKRIAYQKAYQFILYWVILSVILLSVIPEKKSRYLMPVLIPLSLSIGFYLEYLVRCFKTMTDRKEKLSVNFYFVLLAFSFVGAAVYMHLKVGFHFLTIPVALIGAIFMMSYLYKKEILKLIYTIPIILGFLGLSGLITKFPNTNSVSYNITSLQETSKQLPVYSLVRASPDIIWPYGQKIPRIYKSADSLKKSKSIPSEDSFLVLEPGNSTLKVSEYFAEYDIKYQGFLDLNTVTMQSRNYKKRKTAQVYLIEK